jgi:hypothetical protein
VVGYIIFKWIRGYMKNISFFMPILVMASVCSSLPAAQSLISLGKSLWRHKEAVATTVAIAGLAGYAYKQYAAHAAYHKAVANFFAAASYRYSELDADEYRDTVVRCLAQGIDVNMHYLADDTALILAARAKNIVMVKLLLGKGADSKLMNLGKKTAFDYAMSSRDNGMAAVLATARDAALPVA